MSKRWISVLLAAFLTAALIAGCGNSGSGSSADAPAEATTEKDYSDMVADASETIGEDSVVMDGMTPIEGESLKDGSYSIKVVTSSSMFPVTDCVLNVKDGKMTAVMTMSGTGYLYVYTGTGLEAAKADKKIYRQGHQL